MVTKEEALIVRNFVYTGSPDTAGWRLSDYYADGITPIRCRASGRCRTWVTRPLDFRLPVKFGLRQSFYIERIVDGFHPLGYGNWREWAPAAGEIEIVRRQETKRLISEVVKQSEGFTREFLNDYLRRGSPHEEAAIIADFLEEQRQYDLAARVRKQLEDYLK